MVGDIRGKGLFVGVELVEDKKTKQPFSEAEMVKVLSDIAADGVLVGSTLRSIPDHNNVINLVPALVVSKNQIDQIVSALKKALEKHG
jgi:taurine-pyruvate aminotransferase